MTGLDPEIAAFAAALSAEWGKYPSLDGLSPPEKRAIAEEVRRPFRQGGPELPCREGALPTPAGPMRWRAYTPEGADGTLVYLHGGGFTMFSIDTHDRLLRELAAASGMTVIGLDYALAPEHRYPVALEQVLAFVRDWRAARPGGWLALGGDSAGANLALAAAVRLRDAGEGDAVRALVLNYGAFGPAHSDAAEAAFGGPGAVLNRDEMVQFWAAYAGQPADRLDPCLDLLHADLCGLPPALLVVAECDILAEQSHAVAVKLGESAEIRVFSGATHSFLEAVASAELARRAFAETGLYLRRIRNITR